MKMKRKIIFFVSVLTVFILMIVPSISAIEYKEIVNESESKLNNTLVYERIKDFKIRLLNIFQIIENNFDYDILSILWDMINDIIGAIVIYFTFNGINIIFLLLIPPLISFPLVLMMKLIQFGVYGAILFDLIRNLFILIIDIISLLGSFSLDSNLIKMKQYN
jgi:hypothetical protein